ncbi:MSC_0624 family F1-like ATPase-associated membrane protein [Mycoplasmopsis columbina]|uniref:MSC_0624 family F1-like ATPase-associated membrane protein n=1 Tax=Mycoplasmopsis columbina TaxID=114881 RepID=UPI0004A70872|nr:hypothetical protein [Mycoplasmopsis columbina]VEU76658.1 Uncharacterised protein [Mycoplasmopsis columbina]
MNYHLIKKNKTISFHFSKENLLKLISLAFIFFSALASLFIVNSQLQVKEENFISYDILFKESTLVLKAFNFVYIFNTSLFLVGIFVSLFYALTVVNKNNLRFKYYIYWYLLYLTNSLISLVLLGTLNNLFAIKPISLVYRALSLLPLLLIKFSYDIFSLKIKSKNFLLTHKQMFIVILNNILKFAFYIVGMVMLYLFVKDQNTRNLFNQNDFLISLEEKIENNFIVKFILIFLLFIASLIYLFTIFFFETDNIWNSYVWKHKLKNIIFYLLTFIAALFIYLFYVNIVLRKQDIVLDGAVNSNYVWLIVFALVETLILAINLFIVFFRKWKLLKNLQKSFLFWSIVLSLVIYFLALTNLNIFNQKIFLIIFMIEFVTIISLIFVTLKSFLKKHFILISLLLTIVTIAWVFNIYLIQTISVNNHAIEYWTEILSIDQIFTLLALSLLMFYWICKLIIKTVSLFIVWYEKRRVVKGEQYV